MRTVYSSSGADVTASVNTYLQTNATLILADLYTIGMFSPWSASTSQNYYCYTSAAFSVSAAQVQLGPNNVATINGIWTPQAIQRGHLEYTVGLSVANLEVTWWPDDSVMMPGNTHYSWKKAALSGYLDSASFWMHRAYFSVDNSNQPSALLGTTLMWAGMIQEVESKREYIKFTVPSLLQPFHDVQVPTQVVQAGQRTPAYLPTGPAITLSGFSAGASSPLDLHFSSAGLTDHDARDTFLTAYNGSPLTSNGNPRPVGVRVRDNITSGGVLHIYPYEPVDPAALPSTMKLFYVEDIGAVTTAGSDGFPHVPPPEASI